MTHHRTITTVTTEIEDQKRCPGCETWKPLTEFSKDRRAKDGLQGQCRQCANARFRRYYEAHPERQRDYKASRREADRWVYSLDNGRRRARAAGLPAEMFNGVELEAYWRSIGIDPDRCVYTGLPSEHIDHQVPLTHPDSPGHVMSNLVPASAFANMQKQNKTGVEYVMQRDPISVIDDGSGIHTDTLIGMEVSDYLG